MRWFLVITCLFVLSFSGYCQVMNLSDLMCEQKVNPLNIDASSPAFSWKINSSQRGFKQSAYQIIISDNSKNLQTGTGNIWNSGKKLTSQSIHIKYAGKKLQSAKTYYWKVKVWDSNGQASSWSVRATFTTALLSPTDWGSAKWIGYEDLPDSLKVTKGVYAPAKTLGNKALERALVPLLRQTFTVNKKVAKALVFVSGLGHYEMSINGEKVGDSYMAAGWTDYEKRILYNSYNVTALLQSGKNAIGAIVGNGFHYNNRERYFKVAIAYGYPKLICKLQITYDDGSVSTIVSNESWKTAPSPIEFSSLYGGESYDANLEQEGWNTPQFDDAHWSAAVAVKPPDGKLEAEKDYPVKVNDVFTAKSVSQPQTHVRVYDFGQNASAIIEVKVKGKRGQTIKLTPAELLNEKKLANQSATGRPYYYTYTLKGDGVETWRPRFTYYGFRYVQVEGAVPDTSNDKFDSARVISLQSLHIGNSAPATGTFTCSNELFNKINNLIRWAIKSNYQSVMTDCPHRERLSWLEQDHLMGESIKSNFNVYHLYKKLVNDMMDAQTDSGLVPNITPEFLYFDEKFGSMWGFGFRDSPEWGSSSIILPWLIYKWYGDKEIMAKAYPMMQRYIGYLKSKSENNLLKYGLGDWYDIGANKPGFSQLTPMGITATSIYYYDLQLLANIATLLSKKGDANNYLNLSKQVKQSFNDTFFNNKTKLFGNGSQTSLAMPLMVGLANENDRPAIFKNLLDSLTANDKKLTAGDIGYKYLVEALHENGASQLLYDMNNRDDVPGYGYQIKQGATALTESWQALAAVSNNHIMLGHLMEWFYKGLAGIDQSKTSIAFNDIIIKPEVVGDLTFVKSSYETLYGTIVSEWKKEGNAFTIHVKIPANTTATIYLPASPKSKITEEGLPIGYLKHMKLTGFEKGRAIIKVASGDYNFSVN